MTTIELLRHAKASSRKSWAGASDALRPLNEVGRGQARALATDLLGRGSVSALYSSPLTRCVQTCEPLAESLGVDILRDGRIGEVAGVPVADNGSAWVASAWLGGRALSLVTEILEGHEGQRVVLCSHGDVLPALLALLAGRGGLDLPDVRLAKGARMSLSFDGDRCIGVERVGAPARTPA